MKRVRDITRPVACATGPGGGTLTVASATSRERPAIHCAVKALIEVPPLVLRGRLTNTTSRQACNQPCLRVRQVLG